MKPGFCPGSRASWCASAAQKPGSGQQVPKKETLPPGPKKESPPPDYNPYPPGILPADLVSELERVRREVRLIFQQALAQWRALPPPNLTGQPPTLQGSGYDMVQTLGKLMNFDENISVFKNQACASCHMPYAGFSGPIPSVNLTMVAFPGSFHFRAGKRTAQRYTYAPWFPVLQLNETHATIARNTEFGVVTVMRDGNASLMRRLDNRGVVSYRNFLAVNGQLFCHEVVLSVYSSPLGAYAP